MPREPSAVKTISTAWGRTSPRLSVVVPAQKLLDDLDKRNYALAVSRQWLPSKSIRQSPEPRLPSADPLDPATVCPRVVSPKNNSRPQSRSFSLRFGASPLDSLLLSHDNHCVTCRLLPSS